VAGEAVTWRGCHAGSTTARGWTYCSQEGTTTPEIEVDGVMYPIGAKVCDEHKAAIDAHPENWRCDSWTDIGRGTSKRTDDRPRLVPS
jgi:hypothetical protein